jgi:AAA domain
MVVATKVISRGLFRDIFSCPTDPGATRDRTPHHKRNGQNRLPSGRHRRLYHAPERTPRRANHRRCDRANRHPRGGLVMRIRELTIQNYRAFGEVRTFPFGSNFTAIAGINGRGKTALLDGLALLASRLLPHISPARSGYRSIATSDIHEGREKASLSMKVNCAGIPIEYAISLGKDEKSPQVTHLPASVKKAVRSAYGIRVAPMMLHRSWSILRLIEQDIVCRSSCQLRCLAAKRLLMVARSLIGRSISAISWRAIAF